MGIIVIPTSCKECLYTRRVKRKDEEKLQCALDLNQMNVTHVIGRSIMCPLIINHISNKEGNYG